MARPRQLVFNFLTVVGTDVFAIFGPLNPDEMLRGIEFHLTGGEPIQADDAYQVVVSAHRERPALTLAAIQAGRLYTPSIGAQVTAHLNLEATFIVRPNLIGGTDGFRYIGIAIDSDEIDGGFVSGTASFDVVSKTDLAFLNEG